MHSDSWNTEMLHQDSFRLTTVLKLGIASIFASFFFLPTTTTLAVPLPIESSMVAGYIPPSDQGTPPKDEITRSTSGHSDATEEANGHKEGASNDTFENAGDNLLPSAFQATDRPETTEAPAALTPTENKLP